MTEKAPEATLPTHIVTARVSAPADLPSLRESVREVAAAAPPAVDEPRGRGLSLATHLSDRLAVDTGETGTPSRSPYTCDDRPAATMDGHR